MSASWIIFSVLLAIAAGVVGVVLGRRGGALSNLVSAYKFELNAAGQLEADFTLSDGRVVSLVLDPAFVYEISNALLAAATRMGAKRPGVVDLGVGESMGPKNPAVEKKRGVS